jgi:hypothetical protein
MGWVHKATPRPLYPGRLGVRAGLDLCRKSRPHGIRSLDCSTRSVLLYQLRYPSPRFRIKHVFSFSLELLSETFLILTRIQRDIMINVLSSSCIVFAVLMKFDFSRHFFEKYWNIKFYENPSNGSRVVPCGRTDRHDEANKRFSKFCESA